MVSTEGRASADHPPAAIKAGKVVGPREETSLLAFLSVLLLHRRIIVLCAMIGTAVFGALAATSASLFVSRASFAVRGSASPVQLPGGSAMLRTLTEGADFAQSVNFYSDLIQAKGIAYPVAAKPYRTTSGETKSLAQIYEIDEKDPRIANARAGDRLIEDVSSSIYSRSGVVGLAVKSTDPLVAQQLATNILAELDAFGGTRRQQQRGEEREFVETLLSDAHARLTRAEEAQSVFLRLNREYESSPSLRLQFDRLSREVQNQQQVYTSLVQTYEQAKIEEVRDPAMINIVEPPDMPTQPEREAALRETLLGLAAGALVGIIIAFLKQRAAEVRSSLTGGYVRFSEALKA